MVPCASINLLDQKPKDTSQYSSFNIHNSFYAARYNNSSLILTCIYHKTKHRGSHPVYSSLMTDHSHDPWVSLLVINSSHAHHFKAFCVHSNRLPTTVCCRSKTRSNSSKKRKFNMLNYHGWGIHYHNFTRLDIFQHNMCYCPWRLNMPWAVPKRDSNMHLLAFIFNDW